MSHLFPQYRKLSNNKAFYEITGENAFNEIKVMGSKLFYFSIQAEQYPEKLKIKDMLSFEGYELADEKEWTALISKI